ncbi:hypothetical protein BCR37DRAFT_378643 [Protomyces lactucae-debilis]|uniref:Uncharacterized protein n=1 Tax=Protomyces lactucae-debilis TaxID=2754530 RepID=A0A1Y2FIB2_PROLT|nr:uncharacterized protein BCR37DRAFT_378643 [Protomyces lactucae-debilis]ORY83679.1 hypothetical protein BCR37DRAFT_378643 [Protomyces lactucae-debilis]
MWLAVMDVVLESVVLALLLLPRLRLLLPRYPLSVLHPVSLVLLHLSASIDLLRNHRDPLPRHWQTWRDAPLNSAYTQDSTFSAQQAVQIVDQAQQREVFLETVMKWQQSIVSSLVYLEGQFLAFAEDDRLCIHQRSGLRNGGVGRVTSAGRDRLCGFYRTAHDRVPWRVLHRNRIDLLSVHSRAQWHDPKETRNCHIFVSLSR